MKLRQLYRLPDEGYVAGVCAGLAHGLNWNAWVLRAVWMLVFLILAKLAVIAYLLASLFLKKRRLSDFSGHTSSRHNDSSVADLQDEFNALRQRLQQ